MLGVLLLPVLPSLPMLTAGQTVLVFSLLLGLVQVLGVIYAAHAVMSVRSSRGAIAWSLSLVLLPWVAIPLYWIFGRRRFHGYAELLHTAYLQHRQRVEAAYQQISQYRITVNPSSYSIQRLAEMLSPLPFTTDNATELLIDGERTYQTMLQAIDNAQDDILLQMYTLQDDGIGNQFRQTLIAKAQAGVRIYVLYDGIGSHGLSKQYVQSLQRSGIEVGVFKSTRGRGNRFQINFRNHRKIVVADGKVAIVGGLNIGDEYLGKHPPLSPWRDTGLWLQGPAVQCVQCVFLGDWYWATRKVPSVSWQISPVAATAAPESVLIFPTGPADRLPACLLFFVNAINQAQTRLWIASPYFVPDEATLTALKLAALRGVDVRILMPDRPDHLLVYLCAFSYYNEMQSAGVKLYRYQAGFMHQKVILIDDRLGGVGSVNLDNRSFFLNFEMTVMMTTPHSVQQIETMLGEDFERADPVKLTTYNQRSGLFKLATRIARLLAPVL
ncbi:cardiolipin synthase [Alkalinema pantanalense CENA528]|uniref:cardiolipin synthase n=1 Tax=Alkalinema pantanalense TaxID=1620705 RepID=UPI003D6E77A9